MTSLALAALLQLPLVVAANPESYAEARRQTEETGRPLVVIVGAEWCPACQVMKHTILPQVREHGVLRKVAFATVDLDRENALGQNLIGSGPIPQLIMFRKNGNGWLRRKLIGGQSVETVERFIEDGVARSEATQVQSSGPSPAQTSSQGGSVVAQPISVTGATR